MSVNHECTSLMRIMSVHRQCSSIPVRHECKNIYDDHNYESSPHKSTYLAYSVIFEIPVPSVGISPNTEAETGSATG